MATTLNTRIDQLRPPDPLDSGERHPEAASSTVRRFFGVATRPDTYRNLAYLFLGLPLGVLGFTVLVTGVSVSVSMLVVALLGIPMLVGMWYATRALANAERGVANVLLHQRLSYAPIASAHRGNPWKQLRGLSREADRWHEAGFLMLRLPAGIASFTAATAALAAPMWVAWGPFHARIVDDHPFGSWSGSSDLEDLTTSPWSWALVPLGLLLLVVALHALNAMAAAYGRWTTSALTADSSVVRTQEERA